MKCLSNFLSNVTSWNSFQFTYAAVQNTKSSSFWLLNIIQSRIISAPSNTSSTDGILSLETKNPDYFINANSSRFKWPQMKRDGFRIPRKGSSRDAMIFRYFDISFRFIIQINFVEKRIKYKLLKNLLQSCSQLKLEVNSTVNNHFWW